MSNNNNFIIFFIIGIIAVSSIIKYETFQSEIKYTKSSIDGKFYLVRKLPDSIQAADLLATVKHNCLTLVDYLYEKYPKVKKVKRLKQKFNPANITESTKGSKYTSYSVNKGEKIVFCLRSRDSKEKLVDSNTLTFVALHELAHIMTISIGHTEEFWDNFRYLLEHAIKIKVYTRQDFRQHPVKYCGTKITDSPLD